MNLRWIFGLLLLVGTIGFAASRKRRDDPHQAKSSDATMTSGPRQPTTNWHKRQTVVLVIATVIATLALAAYAIFLVLLIKQNEGLQTSINSQAYQGVISTEFDGLLTVLENDQLQDIYLAPFEFEIDVEEMSPEEKHARVGAIILFEFYSNLHVQWEEGAISDEMWCPWIIEIDLFLDGFPKMRSTWRALESLYNESFKTLINQRLEEPRPPYPERCDRILGTPTPRVIMGAP